MTGRILQITLDVPAWMDRALCAEVGGDLWHPEMGESSREAKMVCRGCPVRGECLEYALDTNQDHGIWGGTSHQERRRLKREAA